MFRVLIALDGSPADARVVELAGPLLAGRELELTLLHIAPVPRGDDQGQASIAVLEGFVDAEACDDEVGPLVEQFQARLGRQGGAGPHEPRLVPRHLLHRGDPQSVLEHCGIAQGRRDSLDLLHHADRLLQAGGIDAARILKDSAIGSPAAIVWETARHFGADLLLIGGHGLSQAWHPGDDPAHMPCPVLAVLADPAHANHLAVL